MKREAHAYDWIANICRCTYVGVCNLRWVYVQLSISWDKERNKILVDDDAV